MNYMLPFFGLWYHLTFQVQCIQVSQMQEKVFVKPFPHPAFKGKTGRPEICSVVNNSSFLIVINLIIPGLFLIPIKTIGIIYEYRTELLFSKNFF